MTNTSKPVTNNVVDTAGEASAQTAATLTTLMHRSVERLAGLQKATLDLLGNQTEDMNKTIRESLKVTPRTPVSSFFELADQSLQGWISTQKTIVDLVVQQSAYVADAAKERTLFTKPAEFMSGLVKESVERTVEADKTVLDFAAAQNKNVSDAIRKQKGVTGSPLAAATDSLEKNFGATIEAQKEALDTAARLPRSAKV